MTAIKLLFVCMGNICRSPTAHAMMRHQVQSRGLADRIEIDSAGTHAYHVGELPDPRSRHTAQARGIGTDNIYARKIQSEDYTEFDFILAMDKQNLDLIQAGAPAHSSARIELFLQAARRADLTEQFEVPDPYYGGDEGFEQVFDLVDLGCDALLNELLD